MTDHAPQIHRMYLGDMTWRNISFLSSDAERHISHSIVIVHSICTAWRRNWWSESAYVRLLCVRYYF